MTMNKLLLIILCLTTTTIALDEEPESIHINKLEILLYGSHKVQVLKVLAWCQYTQRIPDILNTRTA